MLRRFADTLYEELLASFPAGGPYDQASFSRAPMPARISRYLAQALAARVEVEAARVRPTASSWFDLEAPDVRRAAQEYAQVIIQHGQFPEDEWTPALERAVRNVVAYHTRPARTLIDFLFPKDQDVYTSEGLSRKLAYFMPYPHLDDALESFLEAEGSDEIGQEDVAALLEQVDEQMVRDHDAESWMQWVEPLHDMAAVIGGYEGSIPIELYIAFFRDKRAGRVERRLERLHEHEGVDLLSVAELRALLEEAKEPARRPHAAVRHERVVVPERKPLSVEESPSQSATPGGADAQLSAEAPSRPASAPVAAQPAGPSPVPLWKQFQQEPTAPKIERTSAPRPALPASPPGPVSEPSEPRPLWMRFAGGQGKEAQAPRSARTPEHRDDAPPLDQLEHMVLGRQAARNRSMYVAELFDHSEEAYRSALLRLRESRSWQEASRIIANDVFRPRGVDIYSDPAIAFTDAVEARFEARS